MGGLSDLERRIEHLRTCASSGPVSPGLVVEIESVLSEGYVCALRADARSYRLRERVDALVEDVDEPFTAVDEEVLRLARERRTIARSTSRLRERLATLSSVRARAVGSGSRIA
jgi:hypothetical protein